MSAHIRTAVAVELPDEQMRGESSHWRTHSTDRADGRYWVRGLGLMMGAGSTGTRGNFAPVVASLPTPVNPHHPRPIHPPQLDDSPFRLATPLAIMPG
ncbi:hypothetical protein E4U10_005761 [Claviceps purpurea]|nr:hypothetical protein E4U10_005761 [Claviceps purpurea]